MGAKKKSKKQIEEEKKAAEEERLRIEAEEKKKAEEEAEKQRILEEKRRAEEEIRRKLELARLEEQAPFVQERDSALISKRMFAEQSRQKDLPDKFLKCDPLPDPSNEKDLTTFITLWKESTDKNIQEAVENCQVAENVVQAINLILSEALSQYDVAKINWCNEYIDQIRQIILDKYDQISV